MCQGFLHAISSLQNTSYQLSLGHLDHVELLIRRVRAPNEMLHKRLHRNMFQHSPPF